jgi:hypothetical protein
VFFLKFCKADVLCGHTIRVAVYARLVAVSWYAGWLSYSKFEKPVSAGGADGRRGLINVLLCWVSSLFMRMTNWSAIAWPERFGSNVGGSAVSGGLPKCLIMVAYLFLS